MSSCCTLCTRELNSGAIYSQHDICCVDLRGLWASFGCLSMNVPCYNGTHVIRDKWFYYQTGFLNDCSQQGLCHHWYLVYLWNVEVHFDKTVFIRVKQIYGLNHCGCVVVLNVDTCQIWSELKYSSTSQGLKWSFSKFWLYSHELSVFFTSFGCFTTRPAVLWVNFYS